MMEFTMSRVCLCVCGIVLMASVTTPLIHFYDDSKDDEMQGIADGAAGLINNFIHSEADVITLSMREILPDMHCTLSFNGRVLTVEKDGRGYDSLISFNAGDHSFDHNDIIEISKTADGISIRSLAPQSSNNSEHLAILF